MGMSNDYEIAVEEGATLRSPRNDSLRSETRMIDETFHLTPLDVRRYEFGKALRGYDPERVNQFRDQVAEELERLSRVEPGSRREGARLPRAAARVSRARQGDQRRARLRAAASRRDPRAGGEGGAAHPSRGQRRRRAHLDEARAEIRRMEDQIAGSIVRVARTSRSCAS